MRIELHIHQIYVTKKCLFPFSVLIWNEMIWQHACASILCLRCVLAFAFPAPPRQCIDLFFDEKYSIEPSWECKFDHIEVRDGPFGFSPIIGRYCGQQSPQYIRSSGRYLWIKFVTDGELEAIGFSANYNFTTGKVYDVYAFFYRLLNFSNGQFIMSSFFLNDSFE